MKLKSCSLLVGGFLLYGAPQLAAQIGGSYDWCCCDEGCVRVPESTCGSGSDPCAGLGTNCVACYETLSLCSQAGCITQFAPGNDGAEDEESLVETDPASDAVEIDGPAAPSSSGLGAAVARALLVAAFLVVP